MWFLCYSLWMPFYIFFKLWFSERRCLPFMDNVDPMHILVDDQISLLVGLPCCWSWIWPCSWPLLLVRVVSYVDVSNGPMCFLTGSISASSCCTISLFPSVAQFKSCPYLPPHFLSFHSLLNPLHSGAQLHHSTEMTMNIVLPNVMVLRSFLLTQWLTVFPFYDCQMTVIHWSAPRFRVHF